MKGTGATTSEQRRGLLRSAGAECDRRDTCTAYAIAAIFRLRFYTPQHYDDRAPRPRDAWPWPLPLVAAPLAR